MLHLALALLFASTACVPAQAQISPSQSTPRAAQSPVNPGRLAPTGKWSPMNIGGGGAFSMVRGGPTGVLLAGSDLSGALMSTDRGQSWKSLTIRQGIEATHVGLVGFDQTLGNVFYVGTDEGLWRTDDTGSSFTQSIVGGTISGLAFSPSNPVVGYVARQDAWDSDVARIYSTGNRGVSWTLAGSSPLSGYRIGKLIVHPTLDQQVWAVSAIDWFAGVQRHLLRSNDGGANFSRVGAGLGPIYDAAIPASAPGVLYATTYEDLPGYPWTGHVFRSTNGGVSWQQRAEVTGVLWVDPVDANHLRVIDPERQEWEALAGVWESFDGGQTFNQLGDPVQWLTGWQHRGWTYGTGNGPLKSVGGSLASGDVILWGDGQHVFGSFDGGHTFDSLTTDEVGPGMWSSRGIDNVNMFTLEVSELDSNVIYAGMFDLGFMRSLDGGASWQLGNDPGGSGLWQGNGGNTFTILADPDRAGVVWASMAHDYDEAALMRSDQFGERSTWVPAGSGLPVLSYLCGLSMVHAGPTHQRTLFVTADGDVYRSLDDGASWTRVLPNGDLRFTAVDRVNANRVWAGGAAGLFTSSNQGAPGSWSAVGPSALQGTAGTGPFQYGWTGISHIQTPVGQAGTVFVVFDGVGGGLYRSDNSGSSFTKLLSDDHLRRVALHPTDASILYASSSAVMEAGGYQGISRGVLRSSDGGQTWVESNQGLTWDFAIPVHVDPVRPERVFMGSPGGGLFKRVF